MHFAAIRSSPRVSPLLDFAHALGDGLCGFKGGEVIEGGYGVRGVMLRTGFRPLHGDGDGVIGVAGRFAFVDRNEEAVALR